MDSNLTLFHLFSTNDTYDLKENYTIIKNQELKQISNLKTPNKVVGLFKIPKPVNIDFSKNIIALEQINDPGNLGTIIRLCDWFGIRDIICSENSVNDNSLGQFRTKGNVFFYELGFGIDFYLEWFKFSPSI